MSQSIDSRLIQLTRDGHSEAFDKLMLRYQRLVFKIAVNFTRDKDHALDITQDVFLKAYQRLSALHNPDHFKAWLIRISYNESVSWQRRHRENMVLHPEETEAGHGPSPDRGGVTAWEDRERLHQLLGNLNPKHRLAVVLKYLAGLSIRDIAGVLQCSESVVKNILYRSIRRLSQAAVSFSHSVAGKG